MQTIVTNPYEILTSINKEWIDSLHIQGLKEGKIINHPASFLANICNIVFLNYKLFQKTKGENDRINQKSLLHVRAIFEEYNIKQPEHWSPILNIKEMILEDASRKGYIMFNQAIDGLREYFTTNEDFAQKLKNDLKERTLNCKKMTSEIVDVSKECNFYDNKIKQLLELADSLEDSNPTKSKIINLLKE